METETETETETEVETETETETETEEDTVLPGIENYTLSAEEKAERKELANYLSDIENMEEGVDYATGELVYLADTREEAEAIAAGYGGELTWYEEGVCVVTLPENVSVVEAVTAAATSEKVVVPPAWPNYVYTTCSEVNEEYTEAVEDAENESVAETEVSEEESVSDDDYTSDDVYSEAVLGYNDPYLKQSSSYYQWQHAMVGSVTAWNAGYTGSGVKVAVLDTGVTKQKDINVIAQYDYSGDGVGDKQSHGTHVAGLIAAKANNSAYGAGIAPGASIIDVKVLDDDGSGYSSWGMAGIRKAISSGADIINMSLGGYYYSASYAAVVKEAYNKGVAVFVAAGNDGSKAKDYPAGYPGAIAVGAVMQNKGRTYFSNYGSWVKFSAPGYQLWSLSYNGNGASPVCMSGTSQATPVVCGTAAVVLSSDSSIKSKSGKAKVDALVSKMNKGKVAGSGGAAGIVSLPKALGIPVSTANPTAPTFSSKNGTKFTTASAKITIKAKSKADTIYYSTNGKAPSYKNGVLTNGTKYTGTITISDDATKGKGKVTVQAIAVNSCGKVSKVAKATYTLQPKVSGITITGQNTLIKGKSTTLKATVTPSYAKNKAVTWTSSDSKAVTVKNGKVTATKNAKVNTTYTITATAKDGSNKKATFKITVKEKAAVKKVSFTKNKDTVIRGSKDATYNVGSLLKVEKADGTTGKVTDVTWTSSNTKLATVDKNGKVTAKLPGKVTIKATAKDGSGKSANFTLTIKQYVTAMQLTGSSKLSNGKSITLALTFNGGVKEKAPSDKKVTWSVSPANSGVTVNKSGKVTASKTAKAGKYKVTATAADGSKKSVTKEITVSNNAISSIKLDKKNATIFRVANGNAKTSTTIKATITAKTADGKSASSGAVEFTSSNPGVATVTWKGTTATVKATGKVAGTTVITCQALDGSGKKATCKVTVSNPASKLTITPPGGNDGYVGAGKSIQLSAVVEEELGAVSNKKVTWSSADTSIAKVDAKTGKVTGVKAGYTTKITATLNDGSGLSATYTVAVKTAIKKLGVSSSPYYLNELNPKRTYISLSSGSGGYRICCTYNGKFYSSSNYVFPRVAIEVGNPDVLTAGWSPYYADEFYLYPTKNGETTITLKALDGSGTKVTYKVKVTNM